MVFYILQLKLCYTLSWIGGNYLDKQNTFYWAVIYELVTKQQYEIISLSKDRTEVWLTNRKNTFRIKRENINFSIRLKNDIIQMLGIYERLLSKRILRGKKIINAYVTEQLPVDDYEDAISSTQTSAAKQLGEVSHLLITEQSVEDELEVILKKFEIDDISNFRQLLYAGEPWLLNSLANYLYNRTEKRKKIVNHGKPYFTYLFLAIQCLLFLLMELSGGSQNIETLIRFGAKYNVLIDDGQWWRFITPIFLHIGFMHLLMNSVALYLIGIQVEKIYGSVRFFFIYMSAGIAGVYASYLMNLSISAGASGAIFGCFGALLYVAIIYKDVLSKELMSSVIGIIGINLVFGILMSNVDNAGHIGGLIGGIIVAILVKTPSQISKKN